MRMMLSRMNVMAQRPATTLVPHATMRAVRRREGDCVQWGGGGVGGVDAGDEREEARLVRITGAALAFNVA